VLCSSSNAGGLGAVSAGSEFAVEYKVKNQDDDDRDRDVGYKHAETRQAFTKVFQLALSTYFRFHMIPYQNRNYSR
jgi:hypothetical protein